MCALCEQASKRCGRGAGVVGGSCFVSSWIAGTAEVANAVQDADVHHVMERVASRATQEAAVAATRTQDILKEVLSWGVPEEARMETQLTHDNRDSMKHRFSNPCILEELHREL